MSSAFSSKFKPDEMRRQILVFPLSFGASGIVEFECGGNEIVTVQRGLAEAISPEIRSHGGDSGTFRMVLPVVTARTLKSFIATITDNAPFIIETKEDRLSIVRLLKILGNENGLSKFLEVYDGPMAFDDNFAERLEAHWIAGRYESEIDFISSNVFMAPTDFLKQLSVDMMEAVLEHDNLWPGREKELFLFITEQCRDRPEFVRLLRYVRFECIELSFRAEVKQWIEANMALVSEVQDVLISAMMVSYTSPNALCIRRKRSFKYTEGDELDGIITSLNQSGMISEVKATASSVWDGTYTPDIPLSRDRTITGCFHTDRASINTPNSFWSLDLGETMRVLPTHISIGTRIDSPAYHWAPKSISVLVSNDGTNWVSAGKILDSDGRLNGLGKIATFELDSTQMTDPIGYRYIKLIQTGPNHQGNHYFVFMNFEVFGKLTY